MSLECRDNYQRCDTDTHEFLSLPSSRLEGFNFAYQGISGIWEGFRSSRPQTSANPTPRMTDRPLSDTSGQLVSALRVEPRSRRSASKHSTRRRSHPPSALQSEEFLSAINSLNERTIFGSESNWKPSVATSKLAQRRCALQLSGWDLGEEELVSSVER